MGPILTSCDLCGEERDQLLYPGSVGEEDHDPSIFFSSSRTRAGNFPVVRCTRCGLVRSNPRDDDQTLRRVYSELCDEAYDAEDQNRTRVARDHLGLVTRYCPQPARLLDVGCATGLFVCLAHDYGWQASGLDASSWAVSRARERCPTVRFMEGIVEEVEIPPESFEVVTMWDLLEHVRSPTETLKRVWDWLIQGGWLFMNLPNIESRMARLMGRRWILLLREHLWYFSPATIREVLEKTGFELVQTRPNYVCFSIANILTRLAQYSSGIGRIAGRFSGLRRIRDSSLRFPIGDMNVVARKCAHSSTRLERAA